MFQNMQSSLFTADPFGTAPHATRAEYLRLWEEARKRTHADIDSFERSSGFAVDRDWLDELALHTQIVVKNNELNYQHGRILYSVVRRRLSSLQPGLACRCFETGTARGYSAVCAARAIMDAVRQGSIVTVDILPHNTPMIWNCIDDLDRKKSRRELLLRYENLTEMITFVQMRTEDALQQIAMNRIHFAFLDAQHTYEAVAAELEFVVARQLADDVIVLDDVTPSQFPGVVAAVEELERDNRYSVERIASSGARGYAVATRIAT